MTPVTYHPPTYNYYFTNPDDSVGVDGGWGGVDEDPEVRTLPPLITKPKKKISRLVFTR